VGLQHSDSGVETLAITGRAVIRNCSLQQVSQAVEFVSGLLRFRGHAKGSAVADEVRGEVTVWLLRSDNQVDNIFCDFTQFRRRRTAE
jgi:hypothetical protein